MIYYEAPERVKYHGGYDPADPPPNREDDEEDKIDCDCPTEENITADPAWRPRPDSFGVP